VLASTATVIALSGAACSTPAAQVQEGVADEASARTCIEQLGKVTLGMAVMTTEKVAAAAEAMFAGCASIVAPNNATAPAYGAFTAVAPPYPDGAATCAAGSCTFHGYGRVNPLLSYYNLDGSVTQSGKVIAFDLTHGQTNKVNTSEWKLDGEVTTTATQLDGTLHGQGTIHRTSQAEPERATWDVVVELGAIVLDASGAPTAGSVHVVVHYDPDPTMPPKDSSPRFWIEATVAYPIGH